MNLAELGEIVEKALERGYRSKTERYFPVDPDGDVAFSGYVQRPAAERAVKLTGRGLYDRRGREFVVLPHWRQWLARAKETKEHQEEKLRQLDARIASVTHNGFREGQ